VGRVRGAGGGMRVCVCAAAAAAASRGVLALRRLIGPADAAPIGAASGPDEAVSVICSPRAVRPGHVGAAPAVDHGKR
jgi:hypothetical protein